jgi:hypothetical protein
MMGRLLASANVYVESYTFNDRSLRFPRTAKNQLHPSAAGSLHAQVPEGGATRADAAGFRKESLFLHNELTSVDRCD